MRHKWVTQAPEETRSLGQRLASSLYPGAVVALTGDLGSGKTCLVQGVCRGLGVAEPVTSPAFIIINEYRGRLPVYHFDLYRVKGIEELYDLGCEEYFYGQGVCLVEWSERAEGFLPKDCIRISLRWKGENRREIEAEIGAALEEADGDKVHRECMSDR